MVCGWLILGSGTAPAQEKKAEGLPADVVAAWKEAGAEVGWMGPSRRPFGLLEFTARREELAASRVVPAFRIYVWREGMLAKLPSPARAFGLDLTHSGMTDAGLKELAPLKQLASLGLGFTKVTDAGLKELASLKQLTYLYLDGTKVTDAGLKDLEGLKNLSELYLNRTQVTVVGLWDLRKALPKCTIVSGPRGGWPDQ